MMVIADALKENTTLMTLHLNANPIGPDGGRALLRALRTIVLRKQTQRRVHIVHCNLECEDGEELFDPLEPGGAAAVAAVASFLAAAVLTEIYLCSVCSGQEMLSALRGRGQARTAAISRTPTSEWWPTSWWSWPGRTRART
jgi:hypothetical protein